MDPKQSFLTKTNVYRKSIMMACCQSKVQTFQERFPLNQFPEFLYLASGSYSRVFGTSGSRGKQKCVVKLIKLRPCESNQKSSSDKKQETGTSVKFYPEYYHNVFQEIIIVKVLSNLHQTQCNSIGHEYRVHCFPKVYQTCLVNGVIPVDDNHNMCTRDEYAAICMQKCGNSLRNELARLSIKQVASVCYQLLLSLVAAEILFEYEHRDLHLANILVRPTTTQFLSYVINSKKYLVQTHSIRAFIIDNTFARIRIGQQCYYTNLSDKLESKARDWKDKEKRKKMTDQDRVYVQMFEDAQHNWAQWLPQSNVYWMQHIVKKLMQSKHSSTSVHNQVTMVELRMLSIKLAKSANLRSVLQMLTSLNSKLLRCHQGLLSK